MQLEKAVDCSLIVPSFFWSFCFGWGKYKGEEGRKDGGERCVLTGADMAERSFWPKPSGFLSSSPYKLKLILCLCVIFVTGSSFFLSLGCFFVAGIFFFFFDKFKRC